MDTQDNQTTSNLEKDQELARCMKILDQLEEIWKSGEELEAKLDEGLAERILKMRQEDEAKKAKSEKE